MALVSLRFFLGGGLTPKLAMQLNLGSPLDIAAYMYPPRREKIRDTSSLDYTTWKGCADVIQSQPFDP